MAEPGQGPNNPNQGPDGRAGFSGPEFVEQRANPMPPPDLNLPAEPPPDTAAPHEMARDNWSIGEPAATGSGSRSKVWAGLAVVALIVAVVAGVVVFQPEGAKGEPIAYRWQVGQELSYRMHATMSGTVSMAGMDSQDMTVEMGGVVRMKVKDVDAEGVATVEVTLSGLYLRSEPAAGTSIPSTVHETMKIRPDGSIVEGGLGFSQIGATSQTPPGWDQFSPLLPDGPVSPGDTWSDEAEVPFIGDTKIKVSTESRLLDYVAEDGAQVAVVRSSVHIPLNVEVALSDIAAETGSSAKDLGLPAGADPSFAYDGQMDLAMTARIDPASQELKGMVMEGTMNFDVTMRDLPGAGDVGPMNMDLDMNISMEQFNGRKAAPNDASAT